MEANFRDVLKSIQQYKPVPWDMIPDIGLYMDQVITFITRMYEPLYGDQTVGYLSAPMINNYVKSKLIPRPTGKKYSREQIALLAMIVALKQVSSMEDIRVMLTPADGMTIEQLYTQFCARQRRGQRAQPGDGLRHRGLRLPRRLRGDAEGHAALTAHPRA